MENKKFHTNVRICWKKGRIVMRKRIVACMLGCILLLSGCAPVPDAQESDMTSAPQTEQTEAWTPPPTETETTEPTETEETEPPTQASEPLPEAQELEIEVYCGDHTTPDSLLTDGQNYSSRSLYGATSLRICSDVPFSSIYIRWGVVPEAYTLCWDGGSMTCGTEGFLHEYIELPEAVTTARIEIGEGQSITVTDVRAFDYGTPPEDVQIWKWNEGKADILAIPTHADDELLFFGPLLAYYIHARGLEVQIAYMTNHADMPVRPHELLDGLWTLGVRSYPIISPWLDVSSDNIVDAQYTYGKERVTEWQTELIRRFQPMVIIGHDLAGEYGHGAHQLNAYCLTNAVEASGNAEMYPESAEMYGVWDPPKLYLHLYKENAIEFPVDEPMENCGNATPYEIASAAYDCHKSQHQWFGSIKRGERWGFDCRKFGLYRSTVGSDTGWDIWENIPERT